LIDCIVTLNSSDFGGGLFLNGSDALITRCAFLDNNVPHEGGAAILIDSEVEFSQTLFQSNSAEGLGGALHILGGAPQLLELQFVENTSLESGGGISLALPGGTSAELPVSDSTFQSNVALVSGGAIYIQGDAAGITMSGNVFCENLPENIFGEGYADSGSNSDCDCPGDLNGTGVVDGADLTVMLSQWGVVEVGEDSPADIDGNGDVNGADLTIVLSNWGSCQ
jgi:predicted outer membrane repeat protein